MFQPEFHGISVVRRYMIAGVPRVLTEPTFMGYYIVLTPIVSARAALVILPW
jgi:hypothetical protein